VVGRQRSAIGIRESLLLTAGYVVIALLFGGALFVWRGTEAGMAYLTGFLLEKTLSVDNIFVFVVIFAHFQVAKEHQHRVLFWGVLGALAMRAVMIFAGIALISAVDWIIYLFAAIVIASGVRLLIKRDEAPDLEQNRLLRLVRRRLPMTKDYAGPRFFVRRGGTRCATPLLLTLILIETTDVVFALDSIPAIFGVTRDPLIICTSNAFAVLGLRALYFAVAGMIRRFDHLDIGLSIVLILIGLKMVAEGFIEIPIWLTLAATLAIIGGAIVSSLTGAAPARPPRRREDGTHSRSRVPGTGSRASSSAPAVARGCARRLRNWNAPRPTRAKTAAAMTRVGYTSSAKFFSRPASKMPTTPSSDSAMTMMVMNLVSERNASAGERSSRSRNTFSSTTNLATSTIARLTISRPTPFIKL
jgi:tellurite resistance protein TerC